MPAGERKSAWDSRLQWVLHFQKSCKFAFIIAIRKD